MATPRKHWFRVADSILFEGWSDAEIATMVRLSAYLNTRWARDGKDAESAGFVSLDLASARLVCGRTHRADCERALRALGARLTLSVEAIGYRFEIKWPKWPEFQGLAPRELPASRPRVAPSGTPPPPPPPTHTPKPPEAPSAPPAPRARAGRARRAVDPGAEAAWPAIRAAFAEHGAALGESIGRDRADLIAKRIADGATPDDLVAAVHGYVRANGLDPRGDFEPRRYFRPQTVFKAEGFSDRVDAGRGPRPVRSTVSKAERLWGHIR